MSQLTLLDGLRCAAAAHATGVRVPSIIAMSELNLKIKSSVLNALVAVVGVLSLSYTLLENLEGATVVLTGFSFLSAMIFGWLFSGWYKLIPGEKFQFEPYVVTVLVSFPSALVSGLLYMGVMALSSGSIPISEVLMAGILGGFIGAVFVLPISIILGVILGWYLVHGQKL
ncbi:glutaredoxin [Simiduia sp. 21SJ11W-1]|uniref:glutaredoxin n=1 Tax=Simiduia sp. 21SJ11W-1 TaxID=2909669 RepID=UPI00209EEB6B|nr:glutaredoxin [Simiduia sp. 21SJ11W-1]UTA48151.1 glutaredoxin [Simiduia sp. 21SJ11W-1]